MPGFDLSDEFLIQTLNGVVSWLVDDVESISLRLFINNYQPVPGTVVANLVEPTFVGYEAQPLDPESFPEATVLAHVASVTSGDVAEWIPAAAPVPAQTVYGYFATDADGAYLWAARLASPIAVEALKPIRLQAQLKWRTC